MQMLLARLLLLVACALTLAWVFALLHEKNVRPVQDLVAFFKKQSKVGRVLFGMFFIAMWVVASTKPGDGGGNGDGGGGDGGTNNVPQMAIGPGGVNVANVGMLPMASTNAQFGTGNIGNWQQLHNGNIPQDNNFTMAASITSTNTTRTLEAEDFERGFVLTGVGTDEAHDFSAPPGATVCADWLAFGAAEDWIYESVKWKVESVKWRMENGGAETNDETRLRIHSGGWMELVGRRVPTPPDGALGTTRPTMRFWPFKAALGIVPQANWHLIEGNGEWGTGVGSQFWHFVTPSNTLQLTWQNALFGRQTNAPVSVQMEVWPSGRFAYRYDLSRLNVETVSNVLAGASFGGGAWTTNAFPTNVTSMAFYPLSEEDADDPDPDGDGLATIDELFFYGTDPDDPDSDLDGLSDYDELFVHGSDPLEPYSVGGSYSDGLAVVIGDLDPFSCPEGSTNTVLEHAFYSGATNGAFAYPQSSDGVAVLRVSVSGSGTGDLIVGSKVVPLVAPPQMRSESPTATTLLVPLARGETHRLFLRGDDTLEVALDSGDFAFGVLPSWNDMRPSGFVNFPNAVATTPCIHDFNTRMKVVHLPVGEGAGLLACTWQGGNDVEIENDPPRSAAITGNFPARSTRGITYTLSHPQYLFGQTSYDQTVRFCPRPEDPDPEHPDPLWYSEGDGGDDREEHWCCHWGMCGEGCDCGCECAAAPDPIDEEEFDDECPVHSVPYTTCAHLHAADYTNALQNVQHLGGVLYIREPPLYEQIHLDVPAGHANCCPCPDHWTSYVGVAYKSYRLRLVDANGLPFGKTDASCDINLAGVHPSSAVGDATVAFSRNGEIHLQHDKTVLGVAVKGGDGVDLAGYNALNANFGYPMTVCTNADEAAELKLVANVKLPDGNIHLELVNATGRFAVWYLDGTTLEYRKLLDTDATPAKDLPMSYWKALMRRATDGASPELPIRVTSSAPGHVDLVFRYWNVIGNRFVQDEAVQRITSVNPPLLADVDGDWSLGEGDVAAHLGGKVFRFWTNEDCHKGDYVGQSSDVAPNVSDYVVNGRLDLVNLFPVLLDLKPFVEAWPLATFRLRAGGDRLRFCGVDVPPEAAWAYQTNDVAAMAGGPLHAAALTEMTSGGVSIDPCDYLGSGNAPGVLAFEAANEVWDTNSPELLVDVGGETIFRYKLPLAVFSVDRMCRWRGLRHVCGGSSSIPDRTGEPWNMPDAEACDVDVFFLHGFNVSEADARNWSRQVFKRLWLSGSRARFHGFSWYGDYNLAGSVFNGLHYHQDVYHALKTASAFKSHVEAAQPDSSKRIIMAHSLGNMVAAEALRQGLAVGKYFMFNAAVASEAIDGTLQAASDEDDGYLKYVPSDWHGYTNLCWAANWHRWFQGDANDSRGRMGWPDYFSDALTNAVTVCNYYSSGDEIFEEKPSTPSALSGVFHWPTFQTSWPFVDLSSMFTPSVNAWQKQEVLKGVDNVAGTLAGGWGFHYVSNATPAVTTWRIYTPEEARAMVEDGSIVTNAVFARNATAMFNPSATQDAQFETLAKYIPAVSTATGRRMVDPDNVDNRDLNGADYRSGWGRPQSEGVQPWFHSDMKNMSYLFINSLYNDIVTNGGLR